MIRLLQILLLLVPLSLSAQDKNLSKKVRKLLNAKEIVWDDHNGDGVLKAKSKKTGRWGMYQYHYDDRRPKTLVSASYDSLGFYSHSQMFTIVKKKGKYGILGSPWNDARARLNIRCKYKNIKYTNASNIVAVQSGNKWAYFNASNGDTLMPFVFDNYGQLPTASSYYISHPVKEMPEKLLQILKDPLSVKFINLQGLGLTFLPDEIGECINATKADLSDNHLREIPKSFFNLTKLRYLDIGGNASITDIGAEYAKLVNLKYLNVNFSYGGEYTYSQLKFSDELSKLTNLEILTIYGSFLTNENDLPAFIYKLPKLKMLRLYSFMSDNYTKVNLSKMACKQSLEELRLDYVHDFTLLNRSIKEFSKLHTVVISSFKNQSKPSFIYDMKGIEFIKIVGYYRSSNDDGSYYGQEIIQIIKESDDVAVSKKNKDKEMKKWKEFISKKN